MSIEITDDILAKLSEPVPANHIKTKRQGGTDIKFTSDKWVKSRLDAVLGKGGWSVRYTITPLAQPAVVKEYFNKKENEMVQTVSIGMIACEVTIGGTTKTATVDILVEKGAYGTPTTNAEARAFKRAAKEWGPGAELWNKDEDDEVEEDDNRSRSNGSGSKSSYSNERRSSGSGQSSKSSGISPKQIMLLGDLEVPEDVVDELTKHLTPGFEGTGSALIGHLMAAQRKDKNYKRNFDKHFREGLDKADPKLLSLFEDDEDQD